MVKCFVTILSCAGKPGGSKGLCLRFWPLVTRSMDGLVDPLVGREQPEVLSLP
jgi:hypothetical protein